MIRELMMGMALGVALPACRSSSPSPARASSSAMAPPAPSRTPKQIRREGNHLVGSGSAYLRAHAHNPVDWHPWGPKALALAVKLDRPIFLSIGYVSCHWCHVMETDVFEKDDVARFLNAHFISIKVDREERPDLDAVYMDAVEAMTGRGGWPMTVMLTPSLRPYFGASYVPHDRFLQVARRAWQEFQHDRNATEKRGSSVYARIAAAAPAKDAPPVTAHELRALARRSLSRIDTAHGGFRGRTKFPTPIRWRFLLDAYRKWGDADVGRAVRQTLDAIAAGGIHDQIGGGFFRYSTEPTWTIPHFEKMLYDNAQLALLYLQASAAFEEPRYRALGVSTLEFLLAEMKNPQHGFGASFDADTRGHEGATYPWTPAEIGAVAGKDASALEELLGVTAAGNFEGRSVPTLRGGDPHGLLAKWRPKLLAARDKRPQPAFDPKMVTAWNGLAIEALSNGYRFTGEARFRDAAEAAAEALWRHNRLPSGELARASNHGRPDAPAVLDDYADFGAGLVDLFEATGKVVYLDRALGLSDAAMKRFADKAGGWYFTAGASQQPLGRRIQTYDGVEPSGAAAMILLDERLAALTARDDLRGAARKALRRYAGRMRRAGLDMAGWLDGALLAAGPFYELVIAGPSRPLAGAWGRLLPDWVVGVELPASGPTVELEKLMPPSAGKHAEHGAPRAYVCVHGSCKRPTTSAGTLRRQLLDGWVH